MVQFCKICGGEWTEELPCLYPTDKEENGIKAIQYLQSLISIEESPEDALTGWRKMTEREQNFTLIIAQAMR